MEIDLYNMNLDIRYLKAKLKLNKMENKLNKIKNKLYNRNKKHMIVDIPDEIHNTILSFIHYEICDKCNKVTSDTDDCIK